MSKATDILAALGGAGNVVEVEPCITRLRVEVRDPGAVTEPGLRATGAFGVVQTGRVVQIVVGPEADELAESLSRLL